MSSNFANHVLVFSSYVTLSTCVTQHVLAGGSACRTGTQVRVCVEWTQAGNPVHGFDYFVDFTGDPSNPNLELRVGDDWIVYAENPSTGALANLGAVTTPDEDDYSVKISRTGGAGAVHVGSLSLQPACDNYSLIASGSLIAGNLTGDLIVQVDSGGNGGTATGLTITGTVGGASNVSVEIPKIVEGDVTFGAVEDAEIEIGELSNGSFIVLDDLTSPGHIFVQSMSDGATLDLGGDATTGESVTYYIQIFDDLCDDCTVDMSNVTLGSGGTLIFNSGTPFTDIDGTVSFYALKGNLYADCTVDMSNVTDRSFI